jgi:hypothetical protein
MSRLLLVLSIVWGILMSSNSIARSEDNPVKRDTLTKLDGAWRLVSYKPAGSGEYVDFPDGWQQIKLVVDGRFVWTLANDGKVSRSAGGKCVTLGDEYTEQIEFVSDQSDEWMVGKTGAFAVKLDGNKWYVDGVIKSDKGVAKITEIWEHVK